MTTVKNYKVRCVYDAFESVYSSYLNRLQMGIGFEPLNSKDNVDSVETVINMYRDRILKGRELKGEPADLNF